LFIICLLFRDEQSIYLQNYYKVFFAYLPYMSSIQELALSLSTIERDVLPLISQNSSIEDLAATLEESQVRRAVLWLENRNLVTSQSSQEQLIDLDTYGLIAKEKGLSEIRILNKLDVHETKPVTELVEDSLPQPEIMASVGLLKSQGAIQVEKTDNGLALSATQRGKELAQTPAPLSSFLEQSFPLPTDTIDADVLKQALKRKGFVKKVQVKHQTISLTDVGQGVKQYIQDHVDELQHVVEQLTPQMLASGEWKDKQFRKFDVESKVPPLVGGRLHPQYEALQLLRDTYVAMGFEEMKGPYVETAFWNMDSMWIQQDHPARDEQDTFFVGTLGNLPEEFIEKVKAVHEHGATTGSTGHTKQWDPQVAKQVLLRTHTTATTFRQFGKGIKDGKYFSIDTVFRNEAIDATHLAEFIQAEGFVIGDNLTLSDLMGFIKEFYARLGITKIRFKPTFNPYTEPSLEAHYYDEPKKKWFALINSGIFRPESLYPFGLENKTVIAWGVGATRVASLLNHIKNVREIAGPTVSTDWIADHKTPQPKID
jgi:phenylalanyl-tRNA synthetase alpha chain